MREEAIRAFWMFFEPLVWALNKVGLCSYKWVNVCIGARRRDLFDPLWHHERYGTPIPELPDEVVLAGIAYRATAAEGMVTFYNDVTKERITLYRDDEERYPTLWRLQLSGYGAERDNIAAAHVDQAYRWARGVFGEEHEVKRRKIVNVLVTQVAKLETP